MQYKQANTAFRAVSLFIFILSCLGSTAFAKDYKVEVLIFANQGQYAASDNRQLEPFEYNQAKEDTWQIDPTMLNDEATKIKRSSGYKLLHHLSWGQKALPLSQAATVNLLEQDIQGKIKVYAKQLLYANLDINFNGYNLNEKRRLKLNERHFFDHPKFGIVMQVSRLEKTVPAKLEEDQQVEQ